MRKVECEIVHGPHVDPAGDWSYYAHRTECGNYKLYTRREAKLAGNQYLRTRLEMPPCTCPLIPDDVEMSVC